MSFDTKDEIILMLDEITDLSELQEIETAVAEKIEPLRPARPRRGRGVRNLDGWEVGDTAYFNGGTSNYLEGLPVEVINTNTKSVVVKVPNDPRYRRFAGKTDVRCPNSIIDRKDDA